MRVSVLAVCVAAAMAVSACSSGAGKPTSAPATSPVTAPETVTSQRPPNTAVARPTVTGPVTGGQPDIPTNAMLASYKQQFGYQESEYFVAGTATAYQARATLPADGVWTVTPASRAPYKTRLIVRTPTDPAKFNGTVIVEWLNVTSGRDSDPDFGFAGPEMLRDGYAYIGVSAQLIGVAGGAGIPIPGYHPKGLVDQNPARYATLSHPGDIYSYDIFSQAAQAILDPIGAKPLGELHPRHLIADGESQSAERLVTYVNAIAPLTNIFDGFMIHSRGATGADLGPGTLGAVPATTEIRTDLRVPVMMTETETDLFGLGFYPALQPDTDLIRTWEMSGTSHADQTTLDYGITSGRQWDTTSQVPDFTKLCGSVNDGPEQYIMRAAFAALGAWVSRGTPPPHSPPIQVTAAKAIARDAHGDALGGIRTPAVNVPVESLSGESPSGRSVICSLFGTRAPFTVATLQALYPTHADYVAQVEASATAAVQAGFLLQADAQIINNQAQAANIPG